MRARQWFGGLASSLCLLGIVVVAQGTAVSLPEGHEFTNPDRQPFSLSPDGTRVAYLARATLFLKTLAGGDPVVVPGPLQGRGKTNPVFSPDGRSILYWAQDDSVLQRVLVGGGSVVTVAQVPMPFGLSWGSDGKILIGQGPKGVLRVSADGGAVETLVQMGANESAYGPQMLPGGNAVLFTLGQGNPADWTKSTVVAHTLASGTRTTIVQGRDARYLPSGHLVYVAGTTIMAVGFDARSLRTTGQAVPIAESVQTAATTAAAQYSLAANGALAFVGNRPSPISLELVGLDGTRKKLGEVPNGTTAPRISHDGSKVTFAANAQIYVAELSNLAGMRRVIANGTFPLFSPDGQWLAFGSLNTPRENGEEVLFLQRADGSGEAQLIARPARAPEHWPAGDQGFSFITHRGGANNYDLWAYNPARKEVEPLVVINETAQLSSAFSPDRKWIAYMSSESGDWQVYVRPYPITEQKFQVTKEGGRSPMWTSDGRLVYDGDGRMFAVAVQLGPTPAVGTPTPLPVTGYIQPLLRRNWDLMPDGRSLLMLFRPGPQIEVVSDWLRRVPARPATQ